VHAAGVANAAGTSGYGGLGPTGTPVFSATGSIDGAPVPWIAPGAFAVSTHLDAIGGKSTAGVEVSTWADVETSPGVHAALGGAVATFADLERGRLQLKLESGYAATGATHASTEAYAYAEFAQSFEIRMPHGFAGAPTVTLTLTLDGMVSSLGGDGGHTGLGASLILDNVDGAPAGRLESTWSFESSVTALPLTITGTPSNFDCSRPAYCESFFGLRAGIWTYGRRAPFDNAGAGGALDFWTTPAQLRLTSAPEVTLLRADTLGTYAWVNPSAVPEPTTAAYLLAGLVGGLLRARLSARRVV
jgi:hypothetical protein